MNATEKFDTFVSETHLRRTFWFAAFYAAAGGARIWYNMLTANQGNPLVIVAGVAFLGALGALIGRMLAPAILRLLRRSNTAGSAAQYLYFALLLSSVALVGCVFLLSDTPYAAFSGKLLMLDVAILAVYKHCLARKFASLPAA